MLKLDRSILQTVEAILALGVLFIVVIMVTNVPIEYPTGPTLGGLPVAPELLVPGVLGVIILADTITSGLERWSVIIGVIGAATVLVASVSLYALYVSNPGMFAGGLFTLAIGVPLALLVLSRRAVDAVTRQGR